MLPIIRKTAPEGAVLYSALRLKSTRIADVVVDMDCRCRFHNQPVADIAINFEHHDSAGFLIRQLDRTTANMIADFLSLLEYGEHVTH